MNIENGPRPPRSRELRWPDSTSLGRFLIGAGPWPVFRFPDCVSKLGIVMVAGPVAPTLMSLHSVQPLPPPEPTSINPSIGLAYRNAYWALTNSDERPTLRFVGNSCVFRFGRRLPFLKALVRTMLLLLRLRKVHLSCVLENLWTLRNTRRRVHPSSWNGCACRTRVVSCAISFMFLLAQKRKLSFRWMTPRSRKNSSGGSPPCVRQV